MTKTLTIDKSIKEFLKVYKIASWFGMVPLYVDAVNEDKFNNISKALYQVLLNLVCLSLGAFILYVTIIEMSYPVALLNVFPIIEYTNRFAFTTLLLATSTLYRSEWKTFLTNLKLITRRTNTCKNSSKLTFINVYTMAVCSIYISTDRKSVV